MSLFSKAEECFADVYGGYLDVIFDYRHNPDKAKAALEKQRRDFDNYYHAAEAAIKAAKGGERGRVSG